MEQKKLSRAEQFKQFLKGGVALTMIATVVIGISKFIYSSMSNSIEVSSNVIRSVGNPEAAAKAAELARTSNFAKMFNNGLFLSPMIAVAGLIATFISLGFGITLLIDGINETERDRKTREEKASIFSTGMGFAFLIISIVAGTVLFYPVKP